MRSPGKALSRVDLLERAWDMGTTTALYRGEITSLDGTRLVAAVRSPRQHLRLGLVLRIGRDGTVVGQVHGTASA